MRAETTLLVLGRGSWLEWIGPFVEMDSHEIDIEVHEGSSREAQEALVDRIKATGYQPVILLSHHSTLVRDAYIAMKLRKTSNIHVVAHPLSVASLATNKRLMNYYAAAIPDLEIIPELTIEQARSWMLEDSRGALVMKHIGKTEGDGFKVIHSIQELDRALEETVYSDQLIIQPFISGVEYSVNLVSDGTNVTVFEPVYKSTNNDKDWKHPCKRTRYCPSPAIAPRLRKRLIEMSADYARDIEAYGLLELEFVVDASDCIWFLEVNPRLAATMRMTSVACKKSIFEELYALAERKNVAGGTVPSLGYSAEIPLSPYEHNRLSTASMGFQEYWLSSRVTVAADCGEELDRRLKHIGEVLTDE